MSDPDDYGSHEPDPHIHDPAYEFADEPDLGEPFGYDSPSYPDHLVAADSDVSDSHPTVPDHFATPLGHGLLSLDDNETVPGPSWDHLAVDPFADEFGAGHSDPEYAEALRADYVSTWTSEQADHEPPTWDPDTSAALAALEPHPAGGPDPVIFDRSGPSHAGLAAELWREMLPDEPLPRDADGQPENPAALLDAIIERADDPAGVDVARAAREGLAL